MPPVLPQPIRDWPLSIKVTIALAVALLPLGLLAATLALASYRNAGAASLTLAQGAAVLLPALMWLAALAIGWAAAHWLVVRPLTQARRAVERYRAGETATRLDEHSFNSREMAQFAAAFNRMADRIGEHDREQAAGLVEQKRLTREVHHRVKNNLQIIASLLSLQSRDANDAAVARAYAGVQARVGALALVHRWAYDDETGPGVDLKALLGDLAAALEQSLAASEGIAATIACDAAAVRVPQDSAVPLAFLITEMLSCAGREAAPRPLVGSIQLTIDSATLCVTIASDMYKGDDLLDDGSSTARIAHGMARQLRGTLVHDGAAGSYMLRFAAPVL